MSEYYEDVRSMIKSKCDRNRSHNRTAEDERFIGFLAKAKNTKKQRDEDDDEEDGVMDAASEDADFENWFASLSDDELDKFANWLSNNGSVELFNLAQDPGLMMDPDTKLRPILAMHAKMYRDMLSGSQGRRLNGTLRAEKKDPLKENEDGNRTFEEKDYGIDENGETIPVRLSASATPDMGASPGSVALPGEEMPVEGESAEGNGEMNEMLDELGYILGDIENKYGPEVAEQILELLSEYMDAPDEEIPVEEEVSDIGKSMSFKDMMDARRNGDNMSAFEKSMESVEKSTPGIPQFTAGGRTGGTWRDRLMGFRSPIGQEIDQAWMRAYIANGGAGRTSSGGNSGNDNPGKKENGEITGLGDANGWDKMADWAIRRKAGWNQMKQNGDLRQAYRQRRLDEKNAAIVQMGGKPKKTEAGGWLDRHAPTFGGKELEREAYLANQHNNTPPKGADTPQNGASAA